MKINCEYIMRYLKDPAHKLRGLKRWPLVMIQ